MPNDLLSRVERLKPDLVHLHWIGGGFVPVRTLARFSRPVVWTLHDMWAFTGGCYYDQNCGAFISGCGRCPLLGSGRQRDLSYWVWKQKYQLWPRANLTLVSPSRWLAEQTRASAIFRSARIEVIPNGLDLSVFKPVEKRFARQALNLPLDKKLVLFGALNAADKRKGFAFLQSALQQLSMQADLARETEAVVFGTSDSGGVPRMALRTHWLGRFSDEISLALIYSAADVFVAPSTQENLSNTVSESLACATPSVAFSVGGMSDLIDHEVTGYLAKAQDAVDLAQGIKWVLEDENRWRTLAQQARAKAECQFDLSRISQRFAALYQELLSAAGTPQPRPEIQ
jgi:glycosyltransferase involved in cell wall biosynthesis